MLRHYEHSMESEPYYASARVEISEPGLWINSLAKAFNTRVLARPMLSEKHFTGLLVSGQHRISALRNRMAGLKSDVILTFVADTPRGIWAVVEGYDEISSVVYRSPVEPDPPVILVNPHDTLVSVVGLFNDTQAFTSEIAGIFGDRTSIEIRPLKFPPVERLLELEANVETLLDETDLEIIEGCIVEGYFETPRGITQEKLAEKFGMSKTKLNKRMKRLQGLGFRKVLSMFRVEPAVSERMAEIFADHPELFVGSRVPRPRRRDQSSPGRKPS